MLHNEQNRPKYDLLGLQKGLITITGASEHQCLSHSELTMPASAVPRIRLSTLILRYHFIGLL